MLNTDTQLSCTFIDSESREIASEYFLALNSPVSLGLWLCLKYKDDISACSHDIDPLNYMTAETFRPDYLAVCFLQKYKSGVKSQEEIRRKRAYEKFSACEDRLRVAGRAFRECTNRFTTAEARVFSRAQEKIAHILGDVRKQFKIDSCGFGPGSSSSIKRQKAHPSNKFISADVSSACVTFVSWFFQDANFPRPKLNLVEHSRIEYVPKNFKIDRIIAVEPDWNIFFQKGFGSAIRKSLQRVGLDLDRNAEVHSRLAHESSLSGDLATIDLSSASDSIGTYLIRYLLPDDWFFCLNSTRTDRIKIDQTILPLLKFSSMGNGFTFELESLVFYALAKACCEELGIAGRVSVFGDDIILPTTAVKLLTQVLSVAGFVLNQDKSYSTGYFRESCGAHFFNGMDVKPIFLKTGLLHDIERFKFCNAIRRLALRSFHHDVRDSFLHSVYSACRNRIHRVFLIPEGYGDGGLVSYFDEVQPSTIRARDPSIRKYLTGIEGFRVRCLQPVSQQAVIDHDGMMVHKLRSSFLKGKSIWHLGGVPLWRVTASDLKRADNLPQVGNSVNISLVNVKYRVGMMHVPHWLDPGQT